MWSSVVECLCSIQKILSLILHTPNNKTYKWKTDTLQNQQKEQAHYSMRIILKEFNFQNKSLTINRVLFYSCLMISPLLNDPSYFLCHLAFMISCCITSIPKIVWLSKTALFFDLMLPVISHLQSALHFIFSVQDPPSKICH